MDFRDAMAKQKLRPASNLSGYLDWLQIRLIGPYFSSFSTNSYGYYPQMSQNLSSISQIFASVQIARQAAIRSRFSRTKAYAGMSRSRKTATTPVGGVFATPSACYDGQNLNLFTLTGEQTVLEGGVEIDCIPGFEK